MILNNYLLRYRTYRPTYLEYIRQKCADIQRGQPVDKLSSCRWFVCGSFLHYRTHCYFSRFSWLYENNDKIIYRESIKKCVNWFRATLYTEAIWDETCSLCHQKSTSIIYVSNVSNKALPCDLWLRIVSPSDLFLLSRVNTQSCFGITRSISNIMTANVLIPSAAKTQ